MDLDKVEWIWTRNGQKLWDKYVQQDIVSPLQTIQTKTIHTYKLFTLSPI
jgi:hypothetical protein